MKEITFDDSRLRKNETEQQKKQSGEIQHAPIINTPDTEIKGPRTSNGTTKADFMTPKRMSTPSRGSFPVTDEEDTDSHLGRIIFLLSLVLAFGIGVGAYALIGTKSSLSFSSTATSTEEAKKSTTKELGILITGSPREQVLADISIAFGKTSLQNGEKRPIAFFMKDASGTSRPATMSEFLNAILPPLSTHAIEASIGTSFTYTIHSGATLTGVLTCTTRSYANSFATMLEWEKTLATDFIPALNPWYDRKYVKEISDRPFKDERLGSTDVRVLYDMTGKSIIAYGFANKKTLIIAGNREALESMLVILSQQK